MANRKINPKYFDALNTIYITNPFFEIFVYFYWSTGKIISQSPYSFHEFGDVTFPYVFNKSGDYLIGLQSKINGDPLYEQNPLLVSFNVSVNNMTNKTQELMFYFVLPFAILGLVVFYLNYRSGKKSRHSKDG